MDSFSISTLCALCLLGQTLLCTGSETRKHIPPMWQVKIAIRIPNQPRPGSPAAATQYLVIAKPGGGILFVRLVYDIPWKRIKGRGCPLPNVTGHLSAAERAVALGKSGGGGTAHEACIEVRQVRRRRLVAPRIGPLTGTLLAAIARRSAAGGQFPFRLGWQPTSFPVAVRFRFKPIDVNDWMIFL